MTTMFQSFHCAKGVQLFNIFNRIFLGSSMEMTFLALSSQKYNYDFIKYEFSVLQIDSAYFPITAM